MAILDYDAFPPGVNALLLGNVDDKLYDEETVARADLDDLNTALELLMLAGRQRGYEGKRKRLIRREIELRKMRRSSVGDLMEEWNRVTAELRRLMRVC